jgi:hypothetical protein
MSDPWITEEDYHADPVVGGSLSSTGARTLTNYCPARYQWERLNGRPDKPHFDEGRAAHAEVLGVGSPLYVPCDDDGEPYERWQSNDAKAKVAAARARGATPVKADVAQRVADMAAALAAHEIAGPLFARPGRAEQTFVAPDPDTNVMCRIRVDWMPDVEPGQRLILVDYKGTTCAEPGAFARRMAELGYDQQGAFYRAVLVWALDLEVPPAFVLVAQEKEPPYLVTVDEPEDYVLDGAAHLNREALATYARCAASGVWPGYPPTVHRLGVPGWRAAQYEAAADRLAREDLIGVSA